MKRKLLWCLALTGLLVTTSCSQDETVDEPTPQRHAIGFSSFIDKPTRAELNSTNLDAFQVWGYEITDTGTEGFILNNEKIQKTDEGWGYAIKSNTAYWRPDSKYIFYGFAPADKITQTTGGGGEITVFTDRETVQSPSVQFINVNGETDLIAAINDQFYATAWTPTSTAIATMSFNHLLTRIHFAFKNSMEDGASLEISGVTITNSPYKGEATVSKEINGVRTVASWVKTAEAAINNTYANLNFAGAIYPVGATDAEVFEIVGGSKSTYIKNKMTAETKALLIIPDPNVTLTVDFTIKHKKTELETVYNKRSVIITAPEGGWKSGYCYQLTAEITSQNIDENQWVPITFEPSVQPWEEKGNTPLVVTGSSTQPAAVHRR